MNVISVIIYAAELAVAAIILFYVVEMLTMPANMKRVCQGLIVLIAILSVIGVLLGSAPPPASHVGPLAPNSPSIPAWSGDDTIKRGQAIAHAGQTGNVTSPQLHFDCLLYTSDAADDLLCVDLG